MLYRPEPLISVADVQIGKPDQAGELNMKHGTVFKAHARFAKHVIDQF